MYPQRPPQNYNRQYNRPPQNYNFESQPIEPENEKSNFGLFLAIGIVVLSLVISGLIIWSQLKPQKVESPYPDFNPYIQTINLDAPNQNDAIVGNLNSPITIIEYGDTECPYCRSAHYAMQGLFANLDIASNVSWIYRHFPLYEIHTKSVYEAQAVECAKISGGNSAFWLYLNSVYEETQSNDTLDLSLLPEIAKSISVLDYDIWRNCLDTEQASSTVWANRLSGDKIGVLSTPRIFIIFKKPLSKSLVDKWNLILQSAGAPTKDYKISPDFRIIEGTVDRLTLNLIGEVLNTKIE
jgi:protein-disulfide isomerase